MSYVGLYATCGAIFGMLVGAVQYNKLTLHEKTWWKLIVYVGCGILLGMVLGAAGAAFRQAEHAMLGRSIGR